MKLEFESNTSALPFTVNSFSNAEHLEKGSVRIPQMLQSGIEAAQNGDRSTARQLLIQVTEADSKNEIAWLWMASISEYPEELIIFLSNVLSINPNNVRAMEWMQATKSLLAKTFVQRGTEAAQNANKDFAKQCFLQAIVNDNHSEAAWQALAELSDSSDEKIAHLQKAININPENQAAKDALQAAKQQAAEVILQKANRAAISGERAAASEMLHEVFQHFPELEEAWILKSYLADSFSEKIVCYEKVLTLNSENEMAVAGLASLRETMARTELKKTEQAARLAELESELESPEEVVALSEEQLVSETDAVDEDSPTQKLEFPPDFVLPIYESGDLAELKTIVSDEAAIFPNAASADSKYDNIYQETEKVFSPPEFGENSAELILVENDLPQYSQTTPQFSVSDEAAENDYLHNSEEAAISSDTSESLSDETNFPAEPEAFNAEIIPAKSLIELIACPFCNVENEANAFVCGSCRTILTLSDLEMLFAYTEADQEILRQAVERIEAEKNARYFSGKEFINLAIGHINLKNLRPAISYLQKAARMNPNDVMLASQINFLKIRLSEIEQQESANSQLVKGRRILVVDDSATVRKLISSKLEKSGHHVTCAVDGVDALEKIKEFVPDLILLDIMMPQIDGYQVCKSIRANESTKDVPVVMISGKDGFFDKVRGRMAGTTGYITKPFGPETLMKAVETYIAHRGEISVEDEQVEE